MSYVFAKNPYQINVALFSKLPILASIDLVGPMGSNAALVATLQTRDGTPLIVAAAHLDPFTSRMRACQVELLLATLAPLSGQRIVLMGDMNFRMSSATRSLLLDAGWQNVAAEETWTIDQIWAGPGAAWTSEPLGEEGNIPPNLSDHFPVGARISFEAQQMVELPPELAAAGTPCKPG